MVWNDYDPHASHANNSDKASDMAYNGRSLMQVILIPCLSHTACLSSTQDASIIGHSTVVWHVAIVVLVQIMLILSSNRLSEILTGIICIMCRPWGDSIAGGGGTTLDAEMDGTRWYLNQSSPPSCFSVLGNRLTSL